jgi:XTP/dITP diphosphohydrolase
MKLVFASNNKTKSKNFNSNFATIEIVSLEDIGCYEEILETADTIEGNSVLKANYVTESMATIVLRMTRDLK